MSDENKTKVSETTASIRDHIERERRVAAAVLKSGDRVAYSQIMRAASDVEQFTLPIAEERDALAQEVERLRRQATVPVGIERHRGARTYRFRDNPAEKELSDQWHAENTREGVGHGMLAWIMGDGNSPGATTARDEYVAAMLIQWLGTPVGRAFLVACGFGNDGKGWRRARV